MVLFQRWLLYDCVKSFVTNVFSKYLMTFEVHLKPRRAPTKFSPSAHLSVCVKQLENCRTSFREIWCLNLSIHSSFLLKSKGITDTLHEHLPAFLRVSRRIFIEAKKNVSNRYCRESIPRIHILCQSTFPANVTVLKLNK